MITTETLASTSFRIALMRNYIARAFIELMTKVNGEPVYVEDGERIPLTLDRVAVNIIYHIEAPWINEYGVDEGRDLAAETLQKMLAHGFMGESLRLSLKGVSEMREIYRDIIFGAPDGELPEAFELGLFPDGEGFL